MKIKQMVSQRQQLDKQSHPNTLSVSKLKPSPLLTRLQQEYLLNKQNHIENSGKNDARINEKKKTSIRIEERHDFPATYLKTENIVNPYFESVSSMDWQSEVKDSRTQSKMQKNDNINKSSNNGFKGKSYGVDQKNRNCELRFQQSRQRYQNNELNNNQRPLTFGIVKNIEMVNSHSWDQTYLNKNTKNENQNRNCTLLNSQQYIQEKKLKEEVVDEILSRKSATSRKYSFISTQPNQIFNNGKQLLRSQEITGNILNQSNEGTLIQSISLMPMTIQRNGLISCFNHPKNKAKYRLLGTEQNMNYCSKCTINLLQQGFKVQELKTKRQELPVIRVMSSSNILLNSKQNINSATNIHQKSRLKELKQFQQKIHEVEGKINQRLCKLSKFPEVEKMKEERDQTARTYEVMINVIERMRDEQLEEQTNAIKTLQSYRKQQKNQLTTKVSMLSELRNQMNQYRIKFVGMTQNQYQFLMESFVNKVKSFEKCIKTDQTTKKQEENQNQNEEGARIKKIQAIISSLYLSLTDKQNAEITFDKKEDQSEDFYCEEVKQPFRTLFADEKDLLKVSSNDHSPAFNRCYF